LGPLADIRDAISDVRFTPKGDMFSVELDACFVP
jgi:hypothetical protein